MEALILETPRIYLDTCHLIRIAHYRSGNGKIRDEDKDAYRVLDDCIRNRHFGLIFNPGAPLEWVDGSATLDTALEIAAVVDSAVLQYEFEGDVFVYLREILDQLQVVSPRLVLPTYEIHFVRGHAARARRALLELKSTVPEFFDPGELTPESEFLVDQEMPFGTAEEEVRIAWDFKHRRPEVFQGRVNGFKEVFKRERDSLCSTNNDRPDVLGWMKRFLKVDRILGKLNEGIDVDRLLAEVDLTKCPATNLFLNAWIKRVRAGFEPKDNDVDDWMYVPVIPYADLVLTERQLQAFLVQADARLTEKITHNPSRAIEILHKWL